MAEPVKRDFSRKESARAALETASAEMPERVRSHSRRIDCTAGDGKVHRTRAVPERESTGSPRDG
ncbi:MAG TPA: hypothetical protein VFS56_07820 [Gemmatimonadaceae bacterium]|nr:hypothetical protein [Gemmatimonadaceae bacterium]